MVGVGGVRILEFEGLRVGQGTLNLYEGRPWEIKNSDQNNVDLK